MKDISGTWIYKEDFGFGKDYGIAEIKQECEKITGLITYTEAINDEEPFNVEQEISGTFSDNKLNIQGISIKLIGVDSEFVYNLDTWEGTMNKDNNIIGSSYDNEGCFGVFTLKKK